MHNINTGDHRTCIEKARTGAFGFNRPNSGAFAAGKYNQGSGYSSWSASVVLVAKAGNPVPRVTVHYRKLNAITYKDKFPLQNITVWMP
jgi:hypothetical protein